MTRRVLLTGAGGFVGHHTLEHLLVETDWDVVCLDSFRHAGKTDRLREVLDSNRAYADRVTVLTHDLKVPISAQLSHQIGDVTDIISMASESHVDRSITDPRPFVENNVALILTMLEFARTRPDLERFVQVSTDEVYGPAPVGHEHAEWEIIAPSNPYSASKAAQEAIAFSYWRTYGVPLIVTNTMNIIGERQDPEKFIPMVLKRVLAGERVQIHAQHADDGAWYPGSRFYLHARNQADALLFLIRETTALPYFGGVMLPNRYNVVGEREIDNLVMAQAIAEYAGVDLDYEFVDFHSHRPGHDLRYALDGNRMTRLGWSPPVPLFESLRRTVEWTMKHPEWLES